MQYMTMNGANLVVSEGDESGTLTALIAAAHSCKNTKSIS